MNKAYSNDVIEIEFDYYVDRGLVRKTLDTNVVAKMQQTYQKSPRKVSISMEFEARIYQRARLILKKENLKVTVESQQEVQLAHNTPLEKQRINQQLSKLGSTPFLAEHIQINIDEGISMPIRDINEMRRHATDMLIEKLSHQKIHHHSRQKCLHIAKKALLKHLNFIFLFIP